MGGWGLALLQGAGITISIALATLPLALALGLIVALGKRSENVVWRWLATGYTTVFRGVPELLTLHHLFRHPDTAAEALGLARSAGSFSMPPFVAAWSRLASCFRPSPARSGSGR